MNPVVAAAFAFLAVCYFASSVVRTHIESKADAKQKFQEMLAWLEERAASGKGVTKQSNGMFLVWPRGHIDNLLYDGTFAAYVTPLELTSSFRLQIYGYSKEKGWIVHHEKKNVYSAGEFDVQLRSSMFLIHNTAHGRSVTVHRPHYPPHPPYH